MFTQEDLITNVRDLIERRDGEGLLGLTSSLSWNDWAEVVPHLEEEEIAYLLEVLPDSDVPEVLAELDPSQAAEILRTFNRSEAADVLEAMDPDDATDVIDELSDAEAEQILFEMEPDEAAELRELLAYPPDTAGGIMTPAFVAIAPDLRADQAITALRQISQEAETMYYVYVLDCDEHLLGVLSLYRIVLTAPGTPVRELMVTDPITIRADAKPTHPVHLELGLAQGAESPDPALESCYLRRDRSQCPTPILQHSATTSRRPGTMTERAPSGFPCCRSRRASCSPRWS